MANFWPLISDAIGTSTSTVLVWNVLIWIDAPIRFIGSRLLYCAYCRLYEQKHGDQQPKRKLLRVMIFIAHHVNNFEVIFLLFLSSVPVNLNDGR